MTVDKLIEDLFKILATVIPVMVFFWNRFASYSKEQDERNEKLISSFHALKESHIGVAKDVEFVKASHAEHMAADKSDFSDIKTGVAGLHIATEGLRQRVEGRADVLQRGLKTMIGE